MLASGRTAHYGRKPPVQPVIRWRVRWWPAWECEMRGAEGNGGPKERGPELVVVGHVGTSNRARRRRQLDVCGRLGLRRGRQRRDAHRRPGWPGGRGRDGLRPRPAAE